MLPAKHIHPRHQHRHRAAWSRHTAAWSMQPPPCSSYSRLRSHCLYEAEWAASRAAGSVSISHTMLKRVAIITAAADSDSNRCSWQQADRTAAAGVQHKSLAWQHAATSDPSHVQAARSTDRSCPQHSQSVLLLLLCSSDCGDQAMLAAPHGSSTARHHSMRRRHT